jgi:hypothetical protein
VGFEGVAAFVADALTLGATIDVAVAVESVTLDAPTAVAVAVEEEGVTLDAEAVTPADGATILSKRSSSPKSKPIRATNSSPTGSVESTTDAW